MAEHDVRLSVPNVEIVNRDVTFVVDADGERLGTLTVSKGGLGWRPGHGVQERHMSWEQLDRIIQREWE